MLTNSNWKPPIFNIGLIILILLIEPVFQNWGWFRKVCSVNSTPPNLGTGQCITIIDTPGTKDTEGEHKVSRNFH